MASKERSNDAVPSQRIVGWDIGGVNTKVARVVASAVDAAAHGAVVSVESRPFEVRRDPAGLAQVIGALAAEVGAEAGDRHAVTMTAELTRVFLTKREGVDAVLDAVEAALPGAAIHVFGTDGTFRTPAAARRVPLLVASANWMATAMVVARTHRDAVVIDTGTTTTDIIPIAGGQVVALGRTDPDRLASGELVYTGALRTPVEAVAVDVAVGGRRVGLAAEGFALSGDVHLWTGSLAPADYTTPTPDGRPATLAGAGDRLRRAVCADAEMLDDAAVTQIAHDLTAQQVDRIRGAVARVRQRHPSIRTAVVTGLGSFLAAEAACRAGLTVVTLAERHGPSAGRHAPAACVALLLGQGLDARAARPAADSTPASCVDVVVKIGGGLLTRPDALDGVLRVLIDASAHARVLIVPGGGPFADAVRAADRAVGLTDDAAHWMAVMAMDQFAHLIASRAPAARLIARPSELLASVGGVVEPHDSAGARLCVLEPSAWLRAVDPLPHSWDVTSDSIAAWVAAQVRAPRLVLVKPPGSVGASAGIVDGTGGGGRAAGDVVDAYFATARPPEIDCRIVPADDLERLRAALSQRS
jgi:probable H4MPT-linked C1 transfer pathway protein